MSSVEKKRRATEARIKETGDNAEEKAEAMRKIRAFEARITHRGKRRARARPRNRRGDKSSAWTMNEAVRGRSELFAGSARSS